MTAIRTRSLTLLLSSLAFALVAGGNASADDARPSVTPEALLASVAAKENVLILDVRTPAEYAGGHVPGAVNIPYDEVAGRISEIEARGAERVVVYCERGGRAGKAEAALREAGVASVEHLEGDMKQWRAAKRPVEQAAP